MLKCSVQVKQSGQVVTAAAVVVVVISTTGHGLIIGQVTAEVEIVVVKVMEVEVVKARVVVEVAVVVEIVVAGVRSGVMFNKLERSKQFELMI